MFDIISALREVSKFLANFHIKVASLNKIADDAENFMRAFDRMMVGLDAKVENMKLKAEV